MKPVLAMLALAGLLGDVPAWAQPAAPGYPPPMGVEVIGPVPTCAAGPACAQDKQWLQQVLQADPQFQAGKSTRNLGIVLTSVGTSLGALAMIGAWASYLSRDVGTMFCSSCHNDYTAEKVVAVTGAGVMVLSLVVGVQQIVSGSREMRAAKNRYLGVVPVVSVGAHHAGLTGSWSF